MRIAKPVIEVGSRVRLKEDYELYNAIYTKGHEFTVISEGERGFNLRDDDGYEIVETFFIIHLFELVPSKEK